MKRIKCTIAYDGSGFNGFQIQPRQRTVQGEIEKVLKKMHKESVRIHASGRTDTGVHAMNQVFHFDTVLPMERSAWELALKSLLPTDIQIIQIEFMYEDFHARFSALEKEYRYFVWNHKKQDVFRRHYIFHSPEKYDMEKMQQACKVFIGTHDFTSFSSAKSNAKGSKVRTLYEVSCSEDEGIIVFIIRGNGFLQHMVRIIVGALLEVGAGMRTAGDLKKILATKNRSNAGVTIPPEGLYLWDVIYEKHCKSRVTLLDNEGDSRYDDVW